MRELFIQLDDTNGGSSIKDQTVLASINFALFVLQLAACGAAFGLGLKVVGF